jgi:pentatricopeptide repeat protein
MAAKCSGAGAENISHLIRNRTFCDMDGFVGLRLPFAGLRLAVLAGCCAPSESFGGTFSFHGGAGHSASSMTMREDSTSDRSSRSREDSSTRRQIMPLHAEIDADEVALAEDDEDTRMALSRDDPPTGSIESAGARTLPTARRAAKHAREREELGAPKRLRALVNELQKVPKSTTAPELGLLLQPHNLQPHNLTSLLLTLKRRQKWRVAGLIAEWAEMAESGIELNTMQYNLLLSACARAAPKLAMRIYSQMLVARRLTTVVTRNTVMTAVSQRSTCQHPLAPPYPHNSQTNLPTTAKQQALALDDHEKALAIFDGMSAAGLEPSTISYNSAITACAKARDAERALALFRQMEMKGIERTTVTYTCLINACSEGGQLDKAMALFM